MRHAKYDGWFIKTAEAEAEKEEWERLGVVTKARMRRMKEPQESTSSLQSSWALVRDDGGKHVLKLAMGKSNNIKEKVPQRDEESN